MHSKARFLWVGLGMVAGVVGGWFLFGQAKPVLAGNDRHEDYVIATGPVLANFQASTDPVQPASTSPLSFFGTDNPSLAKLRLNYTQIDAVWLLDYRAGKLLGTVVTRGGKIASWAEVDLVHEFDIPPRQNVHFLMTTGMIGQQAALYVAETTTGKFGVYVMLPQSQGAVAINRMDVVYFRPPKQEPRAN